MVRRRAAPSLVVASARALGGRPAGVQAGSRAGTLTDVCCLGCYCYHSLPCRISFTLHVVALRQNNARAHTRRPAGTFSAQSCGRNVTSSRPFRSAYTMLPNGAPAIYKMHIVCAGRGQRTRSIRKGNSVVMFIRNIGYP